MAIERPGFDFASRDYDNIRRDLLARAERSVPEWVDRDPSDFSMMLVDMWAYMGDILHYYIDRAAGEAFITTATQRESVLALANLFDYTPRNRTAATATVYVSNSSSGSAVGVVPTGTTFSATTEDGTALEFYSTASVSVSAGSANVPVAVREGKKVLLEQLTTSATGQVGQRYTLSKPNVLPTSVEIKIYEDGVNYLQWDRVDDISLVASGVNAFSVYVSANNTTEVVFGNRISGRVPPTGSTIVATYNTTNGSTGNIGSNKIRAFKSAVSAGIAISSSTASSGGSDGETVESLKTSLKSLLKSQNRVVTLQDYVDTAQLVNGVEQAVAQYTPKASGGGGGSVTIYALPYVEDYEAPKGASTPVNITVPSGIRSAIKTKLDPLSMLGVTVDTSTAGAVTLVAYPRAVTIAVTVEPNYISSSIQSLIEMLIKRLFMLKNVKFGQDLTLGQVYRLVHSVPGVQSSTVTISGSGWTGANTIESPGNAYSLICNNNITVTVTGGISTSA